MNNSNPSDMSKMPDIFIKEESKVHKSNSCLSLINGIGDISILFHCLILPDVIEIQTLIQSPNLDSYPTTSMSSIDGLQLGHSTTCEKVEEIKQFSKNYNEESNASK